MCWLCTLRFLGRSWQKRRFVLPALATVLSRVLGGAWPAPAWGCAAAGLRPRGRAAHSIHPAIGERVSAVIAFGVGVRLHPMPNDVVLAGEAV